MKPVKRRRWLWIGGSAVLILIVCTAALLVPSPVSRVERAIERFASEHNLVRTEPRLGRVSTFAEEGKGTAYTSSELIPTEQGLLASKFKDLMVANKFVDESPPYRYIGFLGPPEVTLEMKYVEQTTDDWTMAELVCFSTNGRTETTLVVWRKSQGLWERIRSRIRPNTGLRAVP